MWARQQVEIIDLRTKKLNLFVRQIHSLIMDFGL